MSEYTRKPLLLKGALIEFSERFLGPVPNVIIFQYNPETMTRTLEVWTPGGGATTTGNDTTGTHNASQTAQPHDPPESFTLALELDAADALEEPEKHPIAFLSGVADRIAAMEMFLYPQEGSLFGGLVGGVKPPVPSGGVKPVPRGSVQVVLFVWGPGRTGPVRTS